MTISDSSAKRCKNYSSAVAEVTFFLLIMLNVVTFLLSEQTPFLFCKRQKGQLDFIVAAVVQFRLLLTKN